MTELPATTYRDRDTQDPWERFDWIMGAIWLVFLLFPLAAAFTVEATWAGTRSRWPLSSAAAICLALPPLAGWRR